MPQYSAVNQRIVLHNPPVGTPTEANFRLEELVIPVPSNGEMLLRTLYHIDPHMIGRMSDTLSCALPVVVGDAFGGTVSRVESSCHPDFLTGDVVLGYSGWQDFELSDGTDFIKLDAQMTHPSLTLGVLGMPDFRFYMDLLDIGQPEYGETVVVASASGAVGSVVGRVAKLLKGCRVVGVAMGADECRVVVEELGFDACIDLCSAGLHQQLEDACPKGIDIYFESVAGVPFDEVLPLLNVSARVPICRMTSNYNDTDLPQCQDRLGGMIRTLCNNRIKMHGFKIFDDYGHRYGVFFQQMSAWLDCFKCNTAYVPRLLM